MAYDICYLDIRSRLLIYWENQNILLRMLRSSRVMVKALCNLKWSRDTSSRLKELANRWKLELIRLRSLLLTLISINSACKWVFRSSLMILKISRRSDSRNVKFSRKDARRSLTQVLQWFWLVVVWMISPLSISWKLECLDSVELTNMISEESLRLLEVF